MTPIRRTRSGSTRANRTIEQARVTWGLPGRIAFDHEQSIRGWCYCMPDGETFHLGGIVADDPRVTAALIDATLDIANAGARPARVSSVVPTRAEGLEQALGERGFTCER